MPAEITVAPGLLIAMPQLADPNFERGVVLMVRHEREGSFGLIVNRPCDRTIPEVLESLEMDWHGDPSAPALWGGPVEQGTGWILHEPVEEMESESSSEIAPGIQLSWGPKDLERLAENPPKRMRLVLGYSGWGEGQLEGELSEGAWVNSDVTADLLFETGADELWETSVRRIGIDPTSLVQAAGVH